MPGKEGLLDIGRMDDVRLDSPWKPAQLPKWKFDWARPEFLALRPGGAPKKPLRSTAWLDGLRGFAALMVFHHHNQLWAHRKNDVAENSFGYEGMHYFQQLPYVRLFFNGGHFAVAIFFVISGYVLSHKPLSLIQKNQGSAALENVASALFRRWLRLYLPILGITFLWMCFRHSTKIWVENPPLEPTFWAEVVNWYRTFKNYSFVFSENIYPFSSTYQQHTWSIPIEFKGSIVIYTSVTALSKCSKKARLWCEVGLAIYFLYVVDGYYGTLFMCGMLLCDLHLLAEKDELPEFLTALSAYKEFIFLNLFLFGLYLGGVPTCDYLNRDHMTVISGTPGWKWLSYLKPQAVFDPKWFYLTWAAFLTVSSIPHLPILKNFFETRFCQYLARISFALYLVHGPVMFLLGSRLYSAVGFEWFLNRDNIPGWMNIFPLSMRGPMGLEFAFWAVQIINVPVTLYMAELATKFLDEPSVRFSSWAYRITLAPPSTPKR